jgi:hypothetical protein
MSRESPRLPLVERVDGTLKGGCQPLMDTEMLIVHVIVAGLVDPD